MVPGIVLKVCWLVIFAHSGYTTFQLLNQTRHKDWFKILFHLSVAIVALSFI
ncbi:hypothetical protein [Tumebacillus flagellatus]|uniref:hypothetical protein n=1 Tax=Tumebacillus flagellatus TaxID=1157490 RepID=UPI001376EB43|nr:hypothetical protein [Tumebacillus flagellatus]